MKMSKSEFKTLMKECLSELINEGAFDKKLEQIAEAKMKTGHFTEGVKAQESNSSRDVTQNPSLMNAVKTLSSAKAFGASRQLFEQILMDTAQTTLQKQLREEGLGGSITEEEEKVTSNQLQELSGGDPKRWMRAAFGIKSK